jgi:predicted aldo/keto reductase-like oxidoreductase
VNYLNWCGHANGMRDAVRRLAPRRADVMIAIQLSARDARGAQRELADVLGELETPYVDVVTYYYVEHRDEWNEIIAPGGAAEAIERARADGVVRAIGLTSHQRELAAQTAQSGRLDLLMIRYNAAHRGAERDIFPITTRLAMPVVAFTCLRWTALLKGTREDPVGFVPPTAADCYRFVLAQPAVTVALMAPGGGEELHENLQLLQDWRELSEAEYQHIAEHGERVRRHAGRFP